MTLGGATRLKVSLTELYLERGGKNGRPLEEEVVRDIYRLKTGNRGYVEVGRMDQQPRRSENSSGMVFGSRWMFWGHVVLVVERGWSPEIEVHQRQAPVGAELLERVQVPRRHSVEHLVCAVRSSHRSACPRNTGGGELQHGVEDEFVVVKPRI